ncbi:MAG: DUF4982 domain-containing protein [Lachnospiraceae bacterium]|nr:DUF4982 domain-containing protein [Lachnospiraceae bacterium]
MNQKRLWNDNWYFAKTTPQITWEEKEVWQSELCRVDLPHDWLIYNTLDLYENSIGWYRKEFVLAEEFEDMEQAWVEDICTGEAGRILVRFDGVYMDSTVYVNGKKVGEWKYGYSTFEWDITGYLHVGKNEIVVKVVHLAPNSRWYSGAGIYRNVWLICVPRVHIPMDGVYISTRECDTGYELEIDTELCWGETRTEGKNGETARKAEPDENYVLRYQLFDDNGQLVLEEERLLSCGQSKASEGFLVEHPKRWDIICPVLYKLRVSLRSRKEQNRGGNWEETSPEWVTVQREDVFIGFRTIAYLPEKGFLLNGRKVRLKGTCDHHDLGALGAAFHKVAMRRKFLKMREMGVNAIRTSHNMPAREVMEMADEMGFLVVSEAFDMWEIAKNPYDYARFFKEWADKDVRSWIRRDRNHPSLIMWSIGNEIPDTHASERGQEITRQLMEYVRLWDEKANAPVTIGSNYMPWEGAQKCADIVKMAGYNYAEKYYEEHHQKYPDWIIYGSETSSVVQSRGIYHFPFDRATLIEEDEQCSALGNSTTSWGAKNAEYCITMDRDAEFSCGQFIWTAFDYIGEPTPYQTKNSYFGQIDTAGFPKDSFYLYQAEWTDYRVSPMVHVYPYWDFNPGQIVDVRVCSNAPCVELFVNGISQGKRRIDHREGTILQPHWQIPYEEGAIKAVAYDEKGKVIAKEERHSFQDTKAFVLKADKTTMKADGEDMIFVEISAVDKDGYPVENASDYVEVRVSGAGRLVGLDNGDSTDYDQYKGTVRKLFQGKLLAMIAAKTQPGEIIVQVADNSITLEAIEAPIQKGISASEENHFCPLAEVEKGFVPVRKIQLTAIEGTQMTPGQPVVTVQAKLYPADATDTDVIWKVTDAAGMDSKIAILEVLPERNSVRITGVGDGSFYVRCMSKNGTSKVKMISQLDMTVAGMGEAFVNPYEPVAGAAYNRSKGDVSRGPSDSVGTDKEGQTQLIFESLDFGAFGSDEITLSIFANDSDPHAIQIWKGVAKEAGATLLGDVIYQKEGIWEVFQPETYKLSQRISGVATITIVTNDKLFLEHFCFAKREMAYERLMVSETAMVYGDSYKLTKEAVEQIGNNVSLVYEEMDFGAQGADHIKICGRTPLETNTIQLRISGETEEVEVLQFPHSEEYTTITFPLQKIRGKVQITFVFLPGCHFDFKWFEFVSARKQDT